jgi:hypothetical protein
MSTKETVATVKQGDRVVYAIGGMEYNAVALGTAHFGYNPAIRMHSAFLNLVYLNEQGTPVKIFGAPLLGSEADDEHLDTVAHESAKRDPRFQGSVPDDKDDIYDEHRERIVSNPRTIGWRTGYADDSLIPVAKSVQPAPAESELLRSYETKPLQVTSGSTAADQDLAEAAQKSQLEIAVASGSNLAVVTLEAHPEITDPLLKSSGIDGDAGDWTQSGMDADGFPVAKGSVTDVTEVSPAPPTLAPEPAESSNLTPAEVTEVPVTTAAVSTGVEDIPLTDTIPALPGYEVPSSMSVPVVSTTTIAGPSAVEEIEAGGDGFGEAQTLGQTQDGSAATTQPETSASEGTTQTE